MIRALIFDFDGLILDTEGPVFQSWQELYEAHDVEFSIELYAQVLGTTDTEFDLMGYLAEQTGQALDGEAAETPRRERELALIAQQSVLPGVETYLAQAQKMGLALGVASSSDCAWIEGHLERLGLIDYFQCLIGADDVPRTKPDPALFLKALDCLGVRPEEAVVFEDSPRGIDAAKLAGIFCVAVPNTLSRQLDTSHADLQLDSLEAMPLQELLGQVEARRKERNS